MRALVLVRMGNAPIAAEAVTVVRRRGWAWAPMYHVRGFINQAIMSWSDTKRRQERGCASTTRLGGSALFGNASEWVHVGPSQKR